MSALLFPPSDQPTNGVVHPRAGQPCGDQTAPGKCHCHPNCHPKPGSIGIRRVMLRVATCQKTAKRSVYETWSKGHAALLIRLSQVRALPGELFNSAELPPTIGLTQKAGSESFRPSSYIPLWKRDLRQSVGGWFPLSAPGASAAERRSNHSRRPIPPELSRSRFNRPLWVSNLVGFGPRSEPVAKS